MEKWDPQEIAQSIAQACEVVGRGYGLSVSSSRPIWPAVGLPWIPLHRWLTMLWGMSSFALRYRRPSCPLLCVRCRPRYDWSSSLLDVGRTWHGRGGL